MHKTILLGFKDQRSRSHKYPEHNSKTNDPKVFKLDTKVPVGHPKDDMVLGLKGQRSSSQDQ